jgi:HD-like signal output (HDOD) protein
MHDSTLNAAHDLMVGIENTKKDNGLSTTAAALKDQISAETMRFLHKLSGEVAGPPLELPSYPEAALRVQRVLTDVNAGAERVVKVIGGEAVLASRILSMANSAALNRSGKPVTELKMAVARVGFDTLRTAAISFAVSQLRKASAYKAIEKPMNELWRESVYIAALSFVLARQLKRFAPDMAMLAGLVSCVGKLYILTRGSEFPALFSDPVEYPAIVQQWHPQVARSILENWKMAPEIVDGIAEMEEAYMDVDRGRVTLSDVLATAKLLIAFKDSPDLLAAQLPEHNSAKRMGLTPESCAALLKESAAEVASLRDALGK